MLRGKLYELFKNYKLHEFRKLGKSLEETFGRLRPEQVNKWLDFLIARSLNPRIMSLFRSRRMLALKPARRADLTSRADVCLYMHVQR
jgi:hypothetical protein